MLACPNIDTIHDGPLITLVTCSHTQLLIDTRNKCRLKLLRKLLMVFCAACFSRDEYVSGDRLTALRSGGYPPQERSLAASGDYSSSPI